MIDDLGYSNSDEIRDRLSLKFEFIFPEGLIYPKRRLKGIMFKLHHTLINNLMVDIMNDLNKKGMKR
jgi:hypothetical protein